MNTALSNALRMTALALCVVLAVSAAAQEIVQATALPPATLRELAARDVPEPAKRREIRHERARRFAPAVEAATPMDVVPIAPTIDAPPVTASFASDSTRQLAPADASGAVGRQHVVGAYNSGIIVHSRAGQTLFHLSLARFWWDENHPFSYYDPRIAYDSAADRFVTIAIHDEQRMMFAVSETGDPTGTWYRYSVSVVPGETADGIDFTRLALTRDSVVIATNRYTDAAILTIRKSDLYDNIDGVRVSAYYASEPGITPVTAEDSPVEYLTYIRFSNLYVNRVDTLDQNWLVFPAKFSWSQGFTIHAPQNGSTMKFDTGFEEVEMAVFRGGAMYVVHTVAMPAGAPKRSSIAWWKIDPVTRERLDTGMIDDPTGATFYAYPSLAVNRAGAMLIAFNTFSAKRYASTAYVYRDPTGRWSPETPLKEGTSPVNYTDRWGDYTTTVVDPLNDRAFWTVQIHAANETWATWWSKIETKAPKQRSIKR